MVLRTDECTVGRVVLSGCLVRFLFVVVRYSRGLLGPEMSCSRSETCDPIGLSTGSSRGDE